jgi:outer membrane protein assembly factor BamB
MGPNNEFLYYTVTNQSSSWQLAQWNSSKLWTVGGTGPAANVNTVVAANTGNKYDWNTSITYNGANFTTAQSFRVLAAYYGDYMLCMNGTFPSTGTNMFFGTVETFQPYTYFLVNLNATKGTVGSITWINTITPETQTTVVYSGIDLVNRVFVEGNREQLYWTGYSVDTGAKLWTSAATPQTAMDYYGSQASGSLTNSFYDGKMYSAAYGGIVYCYDTTNGKLLWTYGNGGAGNTTDSGFGVPGNYPTFVSGFAQGVVYTLTSEHTIQTPIYKGALVRALNATTGAEIWTLSSYTNEFSQGAFAIADGFNTWFNGYDNRIYVVGRGPSQTTVYAPQTQITSGNKVVIQGTVMDISHGAQQEEVEERFSTGLPVASDASMKDWMGYVYQQKPLPTNFTGVTVTLMAVDPNHNYITLGTTTTDSNGVYHLTWTAPSIAGDYTVYAVFAGNNGYWGSRAESNIVVTEPAATVAPTTTPQSAADLYFIPAIIGVIVAIIVVGAVLALLVSKKP